MELINRFLKYVGPTYVGKQSVKDYQHLYNSISLLAKGNTGIGVILMDLPKMLRSHDIRRVNWYYIIIGTIVFVCNPIFQWIETGIMMPGRSGSYDAINWFLLAFFILFYFIINLFFEKRINRTIDLLIQIRDIVEEQKKKPC